MHYKLNEDNSTVYIQIPKNLKLGYVNNTKVNANAILLLKRTGNYGISLYKALGSKYYTRRTF